MQFQDRLWYRKEEVTMATPWSFAIVPLPAAFQYPVTLYTDARKIHIYLPKHE